MNRRELLKFSLLAPLAGLFKKKEPEGLKVAQLLECKKEIAETTGTSSDTETFEYQFNTPRWHLIRNQWVYEKDYEIKAHRITDIPIGFWKVT